MIVLGEYRYGLMRSRLRVRIEEALDALIQKSTVLVIDAHTSKIYATIRDELRSAGTPIPENDIWIAALARQLGLPIVSRDAHFDGVNGLDRVSW